MLLSRRTVQVLIVGVAISLGHGAAPAIGQAEVGDPNRANPAQGVFSDTWFAVMMNASKVGYTHVQQERINEQIHTTNRTYFLIKRNGVPMEISMLEKSVESIDGHPLGFEHELNIGSNPIRMSGQIKDGQIDVRTEQFGVQRQQVAYPKGAKMSWGLHLLNLQHRVEVGAKIHYELFVPSQALNVGVPTTIEVFEEEDVDLFGQTHRAHRCVTVTRINGIDIEATGWVDAGWGPIKSSMELLGLRLDMLKCDKATALRDLSGAEMFLNTLIPIGQALNRDRLQSVTFKITSRGGAGLPAFIDTAMQSVISHTPHESVIRVSRLDHAAIAQAPDAPVPNSMATFLKSSPFVTSDDPQVRALADSAAASANSAYDVAHRLRQAVSRTVNFVDLGTAFASAAEVCRNKEGDCTENGVLLAALARAKGIPARLVTGMIYVPKVGSQRDVMGFHMWAQLWINGQWVDMDAAWDQSDVDPTHIALGTHAMSHATMGGLVSSAILKLNDIKIDVVEKTERP